MRSRFLPALSGLLMLLPLCGADLDEMLQQEGLWQSTPETVQKTYPKLLQWSDKSQKELSAIGKNAAEFQYQGISLLELRLAFRNQKLFQIKFSLYNRGDAGEWERDQFKEALEKLSRVLREEQGTAPDRRSFSLGSGVKVSELCWKSPKGVWILRSGAGKKNAPEFITIEVTSPGGPQLSMRQNARAKSGRASLPERLQTDESGAKYLDIPMVNQGEKSYCVPATVERVLRYYGSELDQNAIARLLDADAKKGTSLEKTIERLARISGKLGLRFRDEYHFRDFEPRRIAAFFKRYNSEAKKKKQPQLKLKKASMDAPADFAEEPFAAVRNRQTSDKNKCWAVIQRTLAQGIPVCWGVLLFPEKGKPGKVGGHFRLINGINIKTREIIYTDSWGAGHEKKVMPWDQAWPVTMRLAVLSPSASGTKITKK